MSGISKKSRCAGCRDNFYNSDNSNTGECWSFAEAKVVSKKEVHIDQRPPWDQKPGKFLDCYRKPRHVYVNPDQTY